VTARRLLALLAIAGALVAPVGCTETRDDPAKAGTVTARTFSEHAEGRLRVQEPVVAGSFYPEDPTELATAVKGFLAAAVVPTIPEEVFGIVAPHAGYVYSGPVAGYSYKAVQGRKYDVVVVIGPAHYASNAAIAVLDVDRVRTPLGTMNVDRAATVALLAAGKGRVAYDPGVFAREHSIEVQLPFIQTALGDVPVVLLAVADAGPASCRALAGWLDATFRGRRALFVASSDLSHYHPDDVARTMDGKFLDLVAKRDPAALFPEAAARTVEACGLGPIATLLELFRLRGGGDARVLKYLNSGDTAGGKDRVVGYGAVVFTTPGGGGKAMGGDVLSDADKKALIAIARKTVEAVVRTGKKPDVDAASAALKEDGAAFVTLRKKGDLRGCIGHVIAREPLYLSVRDMAVAAATEDPRFDPVRAEELADIDIEVSVLTPPRPVKDVSEIRVGRDGLILRNGFRQGLLLPQVADEYGWDVPTFLDQTCRKAGLPAGAWKDPATEILSFQAIVFHE
jgi:AmmeMemoRadiSam system protein B/AmmeMemoRadiSam system protein A